MNRLEVAEIIEVIEMIVVQDLKEIDKDLQMKQTHFSRRSPVERTNI